jgi:hypothetical protein
MSAQHARQSIIGIQTEYQVLIEQVNCELEWFNCIVEALKELEKKYLQARDELMTHGAENTLTYRFYETLWRYQNATPGTPLSEVPVSWDNAELTNEYYIPTLSPDRFVFREKRHRR